MSWRACSPPTSCTRRSDTVLPADETAAAGRRGARAAPHHSPARRSRNQHACSSSTTSNDRSRVSSANVPRTRQACADDRSAQKTSIFSKTKDGSVPICEHKTNMPLERKDVEQCGKCLSKAAEVSAVKQCGAVPAVKRCGGVPTRDPPDGILQAGSDAKSILSRFSAASYRHVLLSSEHDVTPHADCSHPTVTSVSVADSPYGSIDLPQHFSGSPRDLAGLPRRSLDSQTVTKHSPCRSAHSRSSGSCRYRLKVNSIPAPRKQVKFDDNITFLHHTARRRHSTPSLLFD